VFLDCPKEDKTVDYHTERWGKHSKTGAILQGNKKTRIFFFALFEILIIFSQSGVE